MSSWHNEETNQLVKALLSLRNEEECYAFLEDVCTIKELLDISQRLSVAFLLAKKTSYTEISAKTGASTATISRVNKCYEYGTGGYKNIIDKMNGEHHD